MQYEKPVPVTAMRMVLKSSAALEPHPEKADRTYELPPHCGGEDAFFIEDDYGVIGVADGVGGWASRGIDPGIYSRQLMDFAAEEVRAGNSDPAVVLQRAHMRTTAEGSSTALILALLQDGSGRIKVANLGDSGFLHLRGSRVLFQSIPQQHSFNFPFQLGAPGGSARGDSPTEADVFELKDVAKGDVLVLGTDGLFDNAFAEEIASLVSGAEMSCGSTTEFADLAAKTIAQVTAAWAKDRRRVSPFAKEAAKEGHRWDGGKLDDITIVVAVVDVAEVADIDRSSGASPNQLRSRL